LLMLMRVGRRRISREELLHYADAPLWSISPIDTTASLKLNAIAP
jgi:hypothetical protein